VEFFAKVVGALILGALIKLAVRLCGHRLSWRLAFLIAFVAVFSA
jgi:hypothetical protein